jgi:hypothetical protein
MLLPYIHIRRNLVAICTSVYSQKWPTNFPSWWHTIHVAYHMACRGIEHLQARNKTDLTCSYLQCKRRTRTVYLVAICTSVYSQKWPTNFPSWWHITHVVYHIACRGIEHLQAKNETDLTCSYLQCKRRTRTVYRQCNVYYKMQAFLLVNLVMIFLLCTRNLYLIHNSYSPFHRKMCIDLFGRFRLWPMCPVLPLNLTHIWVFLSKLIREPALHTLLSSRCQISIHIP